MTLTKHGLSQEIDYLLDLPRLYHIGKAYTAVQAVFFSMMEALKRGEHVRIDGFGIFRLETPVPHRGSRVRALGRRKWKVGEHRETSTPLSNLVVVFRPSKALLRYINQ